MIVLVERYCKTCVFVISIYKPKRHLYVHLGNTPGSSIIGPDPGLCPLLIARGDVAGSLTISVPHLIRDRSLINTERNKKEPGRKQEGNSKGTTYSLTPEETERKPLIFRGLNLELGIS